MRSRAAAVLSALIVVVVSFTGSSGATTEPLGPCAPPATVNPMPPASTQHDHTDRAHHDFACGLEAIAWNDLTGLVPEAMMFGEVDLAGDLAIIATAYKEAGFVTIDVSDPANPIPLGRFQGPRCEELVIDVDCGADVKLHPSGELAFMAIQALSFVPRGFEDPEELLAPQVPGVWVVDLADPAAPTLASILPLAPSGVHMHAFHEIGGEGYVFTAHNSVGTTIARLDEVAGVPTLVPVHTIEQSTHDASVFDDPTDGRTYLSLSAEYDGLMLYDVTDPEAPVKLGTWKDPALDYYMHTAETFRWGDKRFTMLVPEIFSGVAATAPGPVWVLDTTDVNAPMLAGTWRNPSNAPGGRLGFSAHNFWQRDGIMTLAHYHGGVWKLDWTDVLDGTASRPRELGFYVPDEINRPFPTINSRVAFLRGFELMTRPSVWDVATDGHHIYASDITGGFYVIAPTATS